MERKLVEPLVEKYVNANLYFLRFGDSFKDQLLVNKYVEAVQKLEDAMRQQGVTNDQIGKLIKYAKYFYSLKQYKLTEGTKKYVMSMVFPGLPRT